MTCNCAVCISDSDHALYGEIIMAASKLFGALDAAGDLPLLAIQGRVALSPELVALALNFLLTHGMVLQIVPLSGKPFVFRAVSAQPKNPA